MAAVLLGGVTWISSSGMIAKVLTELNRLPSPETPVVLSILVLEDLAMPVYLPLIAVLLAGGGPAKLALSELVAIVAVLQVVWVATRYGRALSRLAAHKSDEIVLLTTFGTVLVWPASPNACTCRPPSEHFWWASRHPGRSPNSVHINTT